MENLSKDMTAGMAWNDFLSRIQVSDFSLHITNCFAVPFEEDPRDPQALMR